MMNPRVTRVTTLLVLPLVFAFASCQRQITGDDDINPPSAPAPVEIRFAHKWTEFFALTLDSTYSVNLSFITVSDFKYYISNIQFVNTDGDTVKIPDTYFLVEHKQPQSQKVQFTVPSGEYYGMSFLIGIDSAKNMSGPHTGALSPSMGMYWNQNDGYIMAVLEGTSSASSRPDKTYSYHVGGTKAPYNVTARRHFKLGGNILIEPKKKTVINMNADARAWFTTPNGLPMVTSPIVNEPGEWSYKISQNYFKMFDFVSVRFE